MTITKTMLLERHGLTARLARHLLTIDAAMRGRSWMAECLLRPVLFPTARRWQWKNLRWVLLRLELAGMVRRRDTSRSGMLWQPTPAGRTVAAALRTRTRAQST